MTHHYAHYAIEAGYSVPAFVSLWPTAKAWNYFIMDIYVQINYLSQVEVCTWSEYLKII